MAYTDRRPDSNRATKIIAVSAFHAAVIYALVAGLTVTIVKPDIWVLPIKNYKPDPLPPPPPEPAPAPTPKVIKFIPPVAVPPLPTLHLSDLRIDPIPLQPPVDKQRFLPLPKPQFAPKQAKPRNNPGLWVTTSDYPSRDIREGNEGTARFLLTIDARGKAQGCEIVSSSGHLGLDKATCKTVTRRARFEPASDTAGAKTAGTYPGTVRWVIPED